MKLKNYYPTKQSELVPVIRDENGYLRVARVTVDKSGNLCVRYYRPQTREEKGRVKLHEQAPTAAAYTK